MPRIKKTSFQEDKPKDRKKSLSILSNKMLKDDYQNCEEKKLGLYHNSGFYYSAKYIVVKLLGRFLL